MWSVKTLLQSALSILGFRIHRFNQLWVKNTREKKNPESSPKQNLNLPYAGNYLHSIYIVLGIISNLEMI